MNPTGNTFNRLTAVLVWMVFFYSAVPSFANVPGGGTGTGANVTVKDNGGTVVLANGIVSITINKSNGNLSNFTYNGTNLLAGGHGGGSFYFDGSGGPTLNNPTYTLTVNPANNGGSQAEVFLQTIASPIDMGVYYDVLRGQQGVYDTMILTHEAGYPAYGGAELRTNMYIGSIFDWLCVDPYRFRQMASPNDSSIAVPGAPAEVTQWTSGIYNGLTECKYAYSDPLGPVNAYGWASSSTNYGIWQTFPSHEYLDGGPMHRELTEHLGNTLLDMFGGGHYGFGSAPNIPAGTFSSKTFGPAFIYANQYTGPSVSTSARATTLFADAQAQAAAEQSAWPYSWFHPQAVGGGASGTLYPQASGRGTVSGTFSIHDAYNAGASPASMWIGLAPNDGGTDFQQQYFTNQFWAQTGPGGIFSIPNVVPGTYNLWAFGPGAAGTFEQANVTVAAGQSLNLGTVTWTPKRMGPTVWDIGIPDRNSNEFHNGEHDITPYSGTLPAYAGGAPYNTPSAWGAFLAYAKQFPTGVNYTAGTSHYADDWNFCQPTTLNGSGSYVGTASKIHFNLASAPTAGQTARLYIGFACNSGAACIITVNGVVQTASVTGSTDGVNAATIANSANGFDLPNHEFDVLTRLGSQGAWGDAYLDFPATNLKAGANEIDITMRPTGGASSGSGFAYDYVRLEMSGYTSGGSVTPTATKTTTPTVVPPTATKTATVTATRTGTTTPTRTATSTPTATPTVVPSTATPTFSPTVLSTATWTATPSGYQEIQLENACYIQGVTEALNAGYMGTGYANTDNVLGAAVAFSLTASGPQTVNLTLRFANGSANARDMSLSVNGAQQAVDLSFPSTGAFTTWQTATAAVTLAAGYNAVTLMALTSEGGPNLDLVSWTSAQVSDGHCAAPNTATLTGTPTLAPPTLTPTKTATVTSTATLTATLVPPTATETLVPSSPTFTTTVVPSATETNTPVPPTMTFTATVTATRTSTATSTRTPSPAPPTATLTPTPVPPTATPTKTLTSSPTGTPVPSTPTPPPTATPTPLPPTATPTPIVISTGSFTIQLLSGVTGDTTNSPHPEIQVVNTGSSPLALNSVSVRYWFNCDCTGQSIQTWVDWAGLIPQGTTETGNVKTNVMPTSAGGQTDYVVYTFAGNLVLQPGQSIQVQSRFNKSDFSNMSQDNDWSFSPNSSFVNADHVTGYLNGALAWGSEPSAAAPTLAALAVPNISTNNTPVQFEVQLAAPGTINLSLFSMSGELVYHTQVQGQAGPNTLKWLLKNRASQSVASGMYLYSIQYSGPRGAASKSGKVLVEH